MLKAKTVNLIEQIDENISNDSQVFSNRILFCCVINAVRNSSELVKRQQNTNENISREVFDLLNDYCDDFVAEKLGNLCENEEFHIEGVSHDTLNGETSINVLIKNDDNEYANLSAAWNEQLTVDNKRKFIKEISLNTKNILILSTKILSPWLLSNDTCSEAAETLIDVLNCLTQESICAIILPLFNDDISSLAKENHSLNDLISSLTDQQRNQLICSFLYKNCDNLNENDIININMLSQSTVLNKDTIKKIMLVLSNNIKNINNSRYFGNILLLIAERLTSQISQDILNLITSLCNQIKGVTRFRVKNILKTISSENSS